MPATAIEDQIDTVPPCRARITTLLFVHVRASTTLAAGLRGQRRRLLNRVKFTPEKWAAAYENLSMLMENERISYPNDPDLVAELEVFKSDSHPRGAPDYTLQRGQDAAIRALCLVTYDLSAEEIDWTWGDGVLLL